MVRDFICYWNCPHCKKPCCENPLEEHNDIFQAWTKQEAKEQFQAEKPCRHIKLIRIERYCPKNYF